MIRTALLFFASCILLLSSCRRSAVDHLLYNGTIYTVDSNFSVVQAMAIKDGKVIATGTDADLRSRFDAKVSTDLRGQTVVPGFIDAHSHFFGYATNSFRVDLEGAASFREVLERLKKFSEQTEAPWILGRGWDQNNWENRSFPDLYELDQLFPNRRPHRRLRARAARDCGEAR